MTEKAKTEWWVSVFYNVGQAVLPKYVCVYVCVFLSGQVALEGDSCFYFRPQPKAYYGNKGTKERKRQRQSERQKEKK